MKSDLWINLPSNDLARAKKFFTSLGFEMNTAHEAAHMVSMFVGANKVVVNLFDSKMMKEFMGGQNTTDTSSSNEVLFSIGAESVEEVDQLTKKAKNAGAVIFAEPDYKDGWMYGSGFIDLDGHRWNVLFMDISKL